MSAVQLLAVALSADPSLSLDAMLRDELRTGTAVAPAGNTAVTGLEDVLTPEVQGIWRPGESRLALRYDPELLIPDLGQGDHLQVLNRGQLEYSWTGHDRVASFVISEEAQYGVVDLFALTPPSSTTPTSPQPPPTQPLQPIPTVIGLDYESSTSLVDYRWGASRRTTVDVGGGYRLNGGADSTAQASFPLEQGPFANASLIYAASRRDTLTSRLTATDLRFSNGPTDLLLEANQEGSRRLAQHLLGTLGVGVAAVRFQANDEAASTFDGYPEASAALLESLPVNADRTLAAGLTVSIAPLIDRLSGTVFESLQVLGRLEWTAPEGISLRALAGYNDPLYGNLTAAEQIEIVQGAIAYQPVRFLRFEAGGIGTWQQASTGGLSTTQWLAFAAVVLQETVQK